MRVLLRQTPSSVRAFWTEDLRSRRQSQRKTNETHNETPSQNVSKRYQNTHQTPLDNSSENGTTDAAGFLASKKKLKPGYGGECRPTKFGRLGKERVRDAAAVMEKLYHKEESLFLTGTLPAVSTEALAAIAAWSGFIVDRLNSWVAKHCPQPDFFWVWEFQKRGALHLHYVIATKNAEARNYILNNFKAEWCRLLESVSTRSGVDCFAGRSNRNHRSNGYRNVQAYAATIQKSIGAYMSKYLTKGFDNANENANSNGRFFPSRWWRVSGSLLKHIKAATIEITLSDLKRGRATSILEDLQSLASQQSDAIFSYQMQAVIGEGFVAYVQDNEVKEQLWKVLAMTMWNNSARQYRREAMVSNSQIASAMFLTAFDISLIRRSLSYYNRRTDCGLGPTVTALNYLHTSDTHQISLSTEEWCSVSLSMDFAISHLPKASNFETLIALRALNGRIKAMLNPVLFPDGLQRWKECKELLQSDDQGVDKELGEVQGCTCSKADKSPLEKIWEQGNLLG